MNAYQRRKGNGAAAHAACAIAFWLFAFAYLHRFQAATMAYTQHVLSGGATHYDPAIGTVVITFTLYLLHLGVYALTRLRRSRHALTYVPSLLALAIVSSGGTHIEDGFSLGVWTWLMPLVLLLWGGTAYAAMKIPYGPPAHTSTARTLWVNLATMCALFLFVGITGNANSVFHYRTQMEALMGQGRFDDALAVGQRSEETDSSLTMLRAYALARQRQMGERLFTYPIAGTSADIVPTAGGTHCLMYPADSLYRFLGAKPLQGMAAADYLRALQRQGKATRAVADYILCGYLIDRDLDRFAKELPSYYAINDSLPRHYREALTLYAHTRENPAVEYRSDVMETDFADLQHLERQYTLPTERKLAVGAQYRATYWWYYEYCR